MADFAEVIKSRVAEIRRLSTDHQGSTEWFEAANLALSVLHDTVGGNHPLISAIRDALGKADYSRAVAAARAVVTLYASGGLTSPRLAIAHELDRQRTQLQREEKELHAQIRNEEVKTVRTALGLRSPENRKAELYLRLAELYLEAYRADFLLEGRIHEQIVQHQSSAKMDRARSVLSLGMVRPDRSVICKSWDAHRSPAL